MQYIFAVSFGTLSISRIRVEVLILKGNSEHIARTHAEKQVFSENNFKTLDCYRSKQMPDKYAVFNNIVRNYSIWNGKCPP